MSLNVNNIYTKPARDNTGALVAGKALTVDATAGGVQFVAYTNQQCLTVELDVQTAPVYVTFDGTTPAAGNGHSLAAGSVLTWSTDRFNTAKWIRNGAVSATVYASPSQI